MGAPMTASILHPTQETLARAADILRMGGLVAMPTETVYGLACDGTNADAVAGLYEAKGRPRFNPLIAHVASQKIAEREALFSPLARRMAGHFWPGPLTLVLPVAQTGRVCDLARAGLDTIALRRPAHPVAQALLEKFGDPLVAPSANRSGHVSPTRADHVRADLADRVGMILDGGPCERGLESTIVSCAGDTPVLLRAGAIATAGLEAFLGQPLARLDTHAGINAPGQLKSHYAPRASLRLDAATAMSGEGYLGFGDHCPRNDNLSPTGDLAEAAANLFAMLRDLDLRYARIAVAPIPQTGLGEAINDRLARAAYRDEPASTPRTPPCPLC